MAFHHRVPVGEHLMHPRHRSLRDNGAGLVVVVCEATPDSCGFGRVRVSVIGKEGFFPQSAKRHFRRTQNVLIIHI